MANYTNLTPEQVVGISYWNAIYGWGISPSDYPQPVLVGGCACTTQEFSGGTIPTGSVVNLICRYSLFPPQYFTDSLLVGVNYDLV